MNNSTIRISRLSWAGIQIRYGSSTIVIDLLENLGTLRSLVGAPRGEAVASADQLDAALVTHLHANHYWLAWSAPILWWSILAVCLSGLTPGKSANWENEKCRFRADLADDGQSDTGNWIY